MTRNEDLFADNQIPLPSPDDKFVYCITLYFQSFLILSHWPKIISLEDNHLIALLTNQHNET